MRVLITGGAGFIGCNAAKRFINAGDEVTIIDDLSRDGSESNLSWLREIGAFTFHRVDVADFASIKSAISEVGDLDLLLHFAAQVAVTRSVTNPVRDFEVNALGTLNVLESVRALALRPLVVFASTNKVYGDLDGTWEEGETRYRFGRGLRGIDEDHPLHFRSPYGCSKGAADQYVREYRDTFGLRTIVLRQSCICGPHQSGSEDQGWVSWIISRTLRGLPIRVFGNGKQVRDLLWIDDLLDLILRILGSEPGSRHGVYNVGGGASNAISLLELLTRLAERGYQPKILEFAEWRPGDQRIYVSDCSLVRTEFSWVPRTGVDEIIDGLIDSLA